MAEHRAHDEFMDDHITEYGAPLGELKNPPSQKQLDKALKEYQAENKDIHTL